MPYEIKNDPYIDPNTGIFINNFGITDQQILDDVEFELTTAQIAALEEDPVPGNFNLAHLEAIHQRIFGDLYPWAGKLRTVDMTKDETRFAHAEHIVSYATSLFAELRADGWLKGLHDAEFLDRFAYYYSEINILHPFREGNGRTQRAFMSTLAMYAGYQIDWSQLKQEDNIKASIAAYAGDQSKLEEILEPLFDWIHEDYFYFRQLNKGRSIIDKTLRDWPN